MDWRDNQQWRKNIRRVDETETEFDLYFQGAVREITIRDRIRRTIQLLEGTPLNSKKISRWRSKFRDLRDLGKDIFFRKRF